MPNGILDSERFDLLRIFQGHRGRQRYQGLILF
jgi:hypothetical protein